MSVELGVTGEEFSGRFLSAGRDVEGEVWSGLRCVFEGRRQRMFGFCTGKWAWKDRL